jgi:IclR family transcriptional regulator, KDG regulon repressor
MKKPKSDYSIQTVSNALRLLEAFSQEDEFGVTELAEYLGLHKNNVFRLLATLEARGYVEQSSTDERYRLGTSCLALANSLTQRRSVTASSRPVLCELVAKLGETAHLAVLRDFEVIHLDGEKPDALLCCGLRVGKALPSHCTALGKVLLAFSEESVRQAFDAKWARKGKLAARTASTRTYRDKLFDHLHQVVAEGFAMDREECEQGLACVAAPIYDGKQALVAALSISGPIFRFHDEASYKVFIPAVMRAAHSISERLGFVG